MKKLMFVLAALVMGTVAQAAQVSPNEYRPVYGATKRTDGPMQRLDTNGFDLFVNGYRNGSWGKSVYEDFSEYGDGDDWCVEDDNTGCSGTAKAVDLVTFPSGNKLACMMIGTQTIAGALDMDAGSLDISGDQTDNDGVECAWGTHGASGAPFVVGTDPAFFSCLQVNFATAAGTDEFHFGFRTVNDGDDDALSGFNEVFDDHHDLAAWSIIAAADPYDMNISTIAADGDTSETDTTVNLNDAERADFCVFVSAAGVATFYYDITSTSAASFSDLKVAPTTATYTFTDAEALVPFFYLIQANAAQTGEVDVYEWGTGYGTFPLTAASN